MWKARARVQSDYISLYKRVLVKATVVIFREVAACRRELCTMFPIDDRTSLLLPPLLLQQLEDRWLHRKSLYVDFEYLLVLQLGLLLLYE